MDVRKEWVEKDIIINDKGEQEVESEWTERKLLIVPGCCEESAKSLLVRLCLDWDDIYENERGQENCRPKWHSNSESAWKYIDPMYMEKHWDGEVKFCPHCGKPMPEIRKRREQLSPICSITDGGYYCDTCGERLHACKCWPAEAHWEVDK